MKTLLFTLCLSVSIIGQAPISTTKIICNGKKTSVNLDATIVKWSTDKTRGLSTVLNGYAISLVSPPYPQSDPSLIIRGTSSVSVVVNERGKVIHATSVSGHQMFRGPALAAAKAATFKRLIYDCKPKKYSGIVTFLFDPRKP